MKTDDIFEKNFKIVKDYTSAKDRVERLGGMKTMAYSQCIILLLGFCFISYKIIQHGGYTYFLFIPVILFALLLANIIKEPLHYATTETRVIDIKLSKIQKDFENLDVNNFKLVLLNNIFLQIEKSKKNDLNKNIINKMQSLSNKINKMNYTENTNKLYFSSRIMDKYYDFSELQRQLY